MSDPRSQQSGFTLLEVLIAMAIVAVVLGSLVRMASGSVDNSAALRERTLALWVAQNQLARLRLSGTWPPPGTRHGKAEQGGRDWQWRQTVSPTPDAQVRMVRLQVLNDSGENRGLLVGYLAMPL